MMDNKTREKLDAIKSDLKFHGIKVGDYFDGVVMFRNEKEDFELGIYLLDFIEFEVDEAVFFITTCVSKENRDFLLEEGEKLTEEEMLALKEVLENGE